MQTWKFESMMVKANMMWVQSPGEMFDGRNLPMLPVSFPQFG